MKRCPICGAHAVEEANTCFECLYRFDTLSTEDVSKLDLRPRARRPEEAVPAPATRRSFSVELRRGAARPHCIDAPLGSLYIGRAVFNDLVIDEEEVLRRHAHLYRLRQGVFMELLSATAKATINGQAATHLSLIRDGDVVGLGSCDLLVKQESGPPSEQD
ncbi:MAG: FHA domain-containing protein [Actinomycetia bacterium]|nr:FHA domain-containing protein [Actinomycetes bacterium]